MRSLRIVLVCAGALGGCATAQRGAEENVLLNSNPPGAEAKVYYFPVAETDTVAPMAGAACSTPCALAIKRNTRTAIRFSKPGFEPVVVSLGKRYSRDGVSTAFTNLSATGAVIDATSGALFDHCPNPVYVNLKPTNPRTPAPKPSYIPALPDDCKVETLPPGLI